MLQIRRMDLVQVTYTITKHNSHSNFSVRKQRQQTDSNFEKNEGPVTCHGRAQRSASQQLS